MFIQNIERRHLLDHNPDLAKCIIQYAKQILHKILAELLYSYIHEIALPALFDKICTELADESYM
jgi:hypothetical protein